MLAGSISLAPASATPNLAEKISASAVVEDSDVPLYRNITEQLQTYRATQTSYSHDHDLRWGRGTFANRRKAHYDVTHKYRAWHWSGKSEWRCLVNLWDRESGWNQYAANPYSQAYGIPQANPGSKMSASGKDWPDDSWTQIRWGLHYIKHQYGTPCNAWNNEVSLGYYSVSAVPLKDSHANGSYSSGGSASRHHHHLRRRIRAFRWAFKYARGCWYAWGGSSCQPGYDCSGMVMRAYEAVGINLPHNTQLMVDSGHLVRIKDRYARKGDIVMYFGSGGAYHTGLVAYKTRWYLDASSPGEQVKVQRVWGDPVFYRVRRATHATHSVLTITEILLKKLI